MNVVTAAMREQRRARRAAERATRGATPRARIGPRPAALIRGGWSPAPTVAPPGSAGPRLLGAAASSVLIAGRAQVAVADRGVDTAVLPLPPVAMGPLPASPAPGLALGIAPTAHLAMPPETAEAPEAPAAPLLPAPEAVETPTAAPEPAAPEPAATPSAEPPAPPPAAAAPSNDVAPGETTTALSTAATADAPAAGVPLPPGPWSPQPAVPPPPGHTSPREPLPSDALAHALGLSPANNPASRPPTAEPRPTRRTRRSRPLPRYDDPRPRRRLLVAAIAVVVLAGAGTAVGVVATRGQDGGSGSPAASQPAAVTGKVASWLSGNVPTNRRIVTTDATLARDLNAAGVPVDAVVGSDESRVGVVVVASGVADPAPAVVSTARDRTVVTLALFTGGADRITVGQVVQGTTEEVRGALAKNATTTAAACKGLRANAAVTIASGPAAVFDAGDLDLRAATLLAVIAQSQPVDVVAAPQDPAEQAAGRAVRTLVVKVQNDAAVREAAASARAPYTADVNLPAATLDAPPGSVVLSWPTDAAATLALG